MTSFSHKGNHITGLKRLKTKTWQWRQGRHIHRDDESVFSLCPCIKGYNTVQGPQGSTTNNLGSTCILRPHPAFSSLESIEPKVIGYFLYGLEDVSLLIWNSSSAEKTRWTLTRTTLPFAWLVKNQVSKQAGCHQERTSEFKSHHLIYKDVAGGQRLAVIPFNFW